MCTDFLAHKMVMRGRSCIQNYVCIKKVIVGVNLHRLIYNVLMVIIFPICFSHQLTVKNIRRGYAQHKGFSRFNSFKTEASYHIENSPFICGANQWNDFYMIMAFIMTELTEQQKVGWRLIHFMPLISFDTLWIHQKTRGILMFSRGIKSKKLG